MIQTMIDLLYSEDVMLYLLLVFIALTHVPHAVSQIRFHYLIRGFMMKNLVPRYLGLEHIILEAIAAAMRGNHDAVSAPNVIKLVNEERFKQLTGNDKNFSSGSVYGTLSRLKGKCFLQKVVIFENDRDVLAYQMTDRGTEVLKNVRSKAEIAMNNLPSYIPSVI